MNSFYLHLAKSKYTERGREREKEVIHTFWFSVKSFAAINCALRKSRNKKAENVACANVIREPTRFCMVWPKFRLLEHKSDLICPKTLFKRKVKLLGRKLWVNEHFMTKWQLCTFELRKGQSGKIHKQPSDNQIELQKFGKTLIHPATSFVWIKSNENGVFCVLDFLC